MNEREEQIGERQPQGDKPNNKGMIKGAKSFIRRVCHNKCEQDKCVEAKTSRPRLFLSLTLSWTRLGES